MGSAYADAAVRCEIVGVLRGARALRANPRGLYGLCATLYLRALPDAIVEAIFASWPHYTGNMDYPVPSPGALPGDTEGACEAYRAADDMYTGEYGALRLNLLDHLIVELERLVN